MNAVAPGSVLLASFRGLVVPEWIRREIDLGLRGVVLFGSNIVDDAQVGELVATLKSSRTDLLVAIDEEGGDVTRLDHLRGSEYPGNAALGVVDDIALTSRVYYAMGARLAALDVDLNFAPSADVNSVAENPIIGTRSFGSSGPLVARHTAAAVRGLQEAGVAACVKHFPGHGSTVADSHLDLPAVQGDVAMWRERDLPPFVAAIEASAASMMTAHVQVPGLTGSLPATFSSAALRDLLRADLGFDGVVVSDALDMRAASGEIGIAAAAVRALDAGTDLLCIGADISEEVFVDVRDAVAAAALPGELLAEAERRVDAMVGRYAMRRAVVAPEPSAAGIEAASRALQWAGEPRQLVAPFVIELDTPHSIASGPTPWSLAAELGGDSSSSVRVDSRADVAALLDRARGRDLVVAVRDAHRHDWMRSLILELRAARPDAVVVEMGVPVWNPGGSHLATYGAARPNAAAAARALQFVAVAPG